MDDIVYSIFGIRDVEVISIDDCIDEQSSRPYKLVRLRYNGESPDVCPECGGKMYKHGKRVITVIDTPMSGYPTILEIEKPRKRCKTCSHMWQAEIENIDEARQMTKRARLDITQRSLRNTFEDVCNDYVLSPNSIKNVFVDYMNEFKTNLRFKTPAFLGIDEIKIKKIGEVTVITDLEHHTLFDMLLGRNQAQLIEYFSSLPDTDSVLWVCSDMYRPFQRAIGTTMPNAQWAIDHFHVVMKANEAVDDVRRKLQQDMPQSERIKTKRGFAYTLKTRERDLTSAEAEKISLARENERTRPFAITYDLKEDFFNIYDEHPNSKEEAQQAFEEWENSIPEDELYDKFRELAGTVHNFYEQIFAYWDCPIAISNGFTETTNRLIRENNVRGRGYSFDVLRARTLYRKANLKLIIENGLITYGPLIPESEAPFHFDANIQNEYDEGNEEDEEDYEPFLDDDIGIEDEDSPNEVLSIFSNAETF